MTARPQTLYDKIWAAHRVRELPDKRQLLYIDRHLVHEVTSPQAFSGLDNSQRAVFRPESILAVPDHNVPTTERDQPIADQIAALQTAQLERNCQKHHLQLIDLRDRRQGIVHVIGPELGFSLPGLTIVCGDSHTSTHGALGALAFGIGTSDVEHVLATQCLKMSPLRNMRIDIDGDLSDGVCAKDVILHIISKLGVKAGIGHCVEYRGGTISKMDVEQRMTICNMSIEMGARAGLIAVDQTTLSYIRNRPLAPQGDDWRAASQAWADLYSDSEAHFDRSEAIDATTIEPMVSWGTTPEMSCSIGGRVPEPDQVGNPAAVRDRQRALDYMAIRPGTAICDIKPEYIFIGSCTNARISDLRSAASIIKGKKVADSIRLALVVPGSSQVRYQAEQEGLDKIFTEAGFQWREAGCSMCLGMNPDRLSPGDRCASTSNRNFEGRQGRGARTHLMSPAMVAAAAIYGHLVDVREVI